MKLAEAVQIIGLTFDGAGAFLIARGFYNTTRKVIDDATAQLAYYDATNDRMIEFLIEQRDDAVYGGALLLAGFIVQLTGIVLSYSSIGERILPLANVALLILGVVLLVFPLMLLLKNVLSKR